MTVAGLDELRAQIDQLDESIVKALAERFALSRETAGQKHGVVHDPDREAVVLEHVAELADGLGLARAHVIAIYELVLRISVEVQDETLQRTHLG